jgi:opacity protein-like surface antigen
MRRFAALVLCLAFAAPAAAQQKEPIGPFAIDVRGALARHKAEPSVATDLNVQSSNLPTRTLGLVGGVHFYPLRRRRVTLGVGGTFVMTRGSKTLDVQGSGGAEPVQGPTVRRRFTTLSPEISLNFGHRNGWSYISGGMLGRSKLYLEREDAPVANAPYRSTINYGGGARWFTSEHLALSVDFRWYSVAEQSAATGIVAQPRTTLLVLSGGVSFK